MFKPQQITAGQTSVLTLEVPAGQPLGSATLNISASATVEGLPQSQSAAVQFSVQAATTSFIGRTVVDDALQTPLAGVTVILLGKNGSGGTTGCSGNTISDEAGNFALTGLAAECVGPQPLRDGNCLHRRPPGGSRSGSGLPRRKIRHRQFRLARPDAATTSRARPST